MNCLNCNQPLVLDASITEKYPEWEAIVKSFNRQRSNISTASSQKSRNLPQTESSSLLPISTSVLGTDVGSSQPSSYSSIGDGQFSVLQHPVDKVPLEAVRGSCLSKEIAVAGNLFDIISQDETAIDHPICQECTNKLLDYLDTQLKMLEDECSDYSSLLENLDHCKEELDLSCLKTELENLQREESAMRSELASLETDEDNLEKELRKQDDELQDVKKEEEEFWHLYRNYTRQLLDLNSEKESLQNQLSYAEQQLDRLQRTNVFNLAFHIWHSGHFGTINGLRLGRLPNETVDWQEINAAWGQVALLLVSLARKLNLTFDNYEIVPYGNHSFIKVSAAAASGGSGSGANASGSPSGGNASVLKELPLYCSGGYKFFWDTKFDEAMVAFLDCLEQLKQRIEKGDAEFCMPYRMAKDKIFVQDGAMSNGYSVKIQFNSEERWTKAMKFMLTNLRWALAWVSSLTT